MARSIYCYDCQAIKENPNKGYCRSCNSKRDKAWRIETGRSTKIRTGLCKCGKPFAPSSKCYCTECATAWRKDYLNRNPEIKQKMSKNFNKQRNDNDISRFKQQVRMLTRTAIRQGILVKKPCEICNEIDNIEAHHDDYAKPLEVRWLCRTHHFEHHSKENSIPKE